MTVHDLWEDLSKAEIAERRKARRDRYQRRWREGKGREAKQRKQGYKEHQKVQADLDDANQRADPKAQKIRRSSVTVKTLMDRHLAAKSDRAPKTVATDHYHADAVIENFGDKYVSTLDATDIEIWAQRTEVARSSRKKQVEILRAALKRGIRDNLADEDITDGIVVPLGHKELPYWSSEELMAVVAAAHRDLEKALLMVLGLMGLRSGEAASLRVRDLTGDQLSVKNSGAGSDTTKTRASRRVLPVPAAVLPVLQKQVGDRAKAAYIFPAPSDPTVPVGSKYITDAITRAVGKANQDRRDPIKRLNIHGLRHTFAAISLSEAGADILSVSRAMGHAKPSITLDRYGHLAPAGLAPLMAKIDHVISPQEGDK